MDADVTETVYVSSDDTNVMSERVQLLAASIRKEFERLIGVYGEGVVKQLTPLVVGVLENLEQSFQERQEKDVELDLMRDDNEQLMTQYEREKQLRKAAELKYFEIDDIFEENKRQHLEKISSLESIIRLFEVKTKNAQDQISRLEEKESETRTEYSKLHERYTDLFKAHMDYIERTKVSMSTDKPADNNVYATPKRLWSSSRPVPMIAGLSESGIRRQTSESPSLTYVPLSSGRTNVNLQQEMDTAAASDNTSAVEHQAAAVAEVISTGTNTVTDVVVTEDQATETADDLTNQQIVPPAHHVYSEQRDLVELSVYDELSLEDTEALSQVDDGADIVGVGREIDNLIQENNELLATKNALNIVKDDLIAKLDELTSENEILREGNISLEILRNKLRTRVSDLEEELRRLRDELENKQTKSADDEADVPTAQRKRFTRAEMARVLLERNQYKERLMELQEAVRWAEMLRAAREHPEPQTKRRSSVWNFFSNLFSPSNKSTAKQQNMPDVRYSTLQGVDNSSLDQTSQSNTVAERSPRVVRFRDEDIAADEARQFRQVEQKKQKSMGSGDGGCLEANGWSLPPKFHTSSDGVHGASIPIPVYCRPVTDDPSVQLWCAAGVDISGWQQAESASSSSAHTVSSAGQSDDSNSAECNSEVKSVVSSSYMWICMTGHGGTEVLVADANNLACVLDKFHVSSSHILCVAAVPGSMSSDNECCTDVISKQTGGYHDNSIDAGAGLMQPVVHVTCSDMTSPETDAEGRWLASDGSQGDCQNIAAENVADVVTSMDRLPTMWLGAQSGRIYVHSAVADWRQCIHTTRLPDAVVDIVHIKGRALVALANGTVVVFSRTPDARWDFTGYYVITLGEPHVSVRCLCIVSEHVWCGYRNQVYVVTPETLTTERSFDVHPRRESQVRQMSWVGDGVWMSIRLDSTLRLYHASTCQHLQDVDIEPLVSKFIGTGNLGFSFVRISCLLVASNRLWVGTGNGVILSIPLCETNETGILHSYAAYESNRQVVTSPSSGRPGGVVRVYGDVQADSTSTSAGLIPYSCVNKAQLSYHGYKDAVKFFVAVPGLSVAGCGPQQFAGIAEHESDKKEDPSRDIMLVIAGGEGYVDFRRGEAAESSDSDPMTSRPITVERSQLLAWQVFTSS